MNDLEAAHYVAMLGEIKQRVRAVQYDALRAVNRELIGLYWESGRLIVERQQGTLWGRSMVEQLARDLQDEFPGVSGFSAPNIWRMRRFYDTYADDTKLAPMVREIGWTHNLIIMEKCAELPPTALSRRSPASYKGNFPRLSRSLACLKMSSC